MGVVKVVWGLGEAIPQGTTAPGKVCPSAGRSPLVPMKGFTSAASGASEGGTGTW